MGRDSIPLADLQSAAMGQQKVGARFVIGDLVYRVQSPGCVHTIRGERIRLISARAATKQEKRRYEETSF